MFDLKLEVCSEFLQVQDPDVEAIGVGVSKEYAVKHHVPLVIGVGSVFLDTAKPKEVFERVKHYVKVVGENGRFYLYLGNLSPTIPSENVRAAIDAVYRYGTYS